MKDGFIKVCAATPHIKVADTRHNADEMIKIIRACEKQNAGMIVFPELSITGYTCGDLFLQNTLLREARKELFRIAKESEGSDALIIAGLPFMKDGQLYNVAAVMKDGELLGLVPKINIPNYSEFYEARHFEAGNTKVEWIYLEEIEDEIPFGSNLLFLCRNMPDFTVGVEICEDLWVPMPPSSSHSMAGATVIANLSASDEVTGKDAYRRELIKSQSARLVCGYLYADAGEGESTTDLVFAGHNLIAENGNLLAESRRFTNECIITELDLERLASERRRMKSLHNSNQENSRYIIVGFEYKKCGEIKLSRVIEKTPFVPGRKTDRDKRCQEIIQLQAMGLKKRLVHTGCQCAVIGISGGLDSALALLVTCKTFDLLGLRRENIISVTMPCFGTTDRTYHNAVAMAEKLGTSLREIEITETVLSHFKDIGQDTDHHDVTYENAQARVRTLVLMDIANQKGGLVVGTGDMSELALGFATYNGDHMSNYGVNSSVPKTLVRHLVTYFAQTAKDGKLGKVLYDILDTPVSPELLPPKEGEIVQKTEDIVGPYELHDFFLYYVMRFGCSPSKLLRLALYAFDREYDKKTIYRWLSLFYRRFFSQQFKRSCLPDGPKVGSVALSPRGDLRMPSDASVAIWLEDLGKMEEKEWL